MVSITRGRDLPEVPVFFFLTEATIFARNGPAMHFYEKPAAVINTAVCIEISHSVITSKGKIVTFITSTVKIVSESSVKLKITTLTWQKETVQTVKRYKHLS